MGKTAAMILGSCLVMQIPALVLHKNSGVSELPSEQSQAEAIPLFVEAHAKELMNAGVTTAETEIAPEAVTDTSDTPPASPEQVARYIHKKTRELLPVPFRGRSRQIAQGLIETANKNQMDPLFLMAVIKQESRFNPEARGAHGEIGLMQLKPSTALAFASLQGLDGEKAYAQVSADLADPVKNIQMGAAYLSKLRASFKRRSSLYISAYNMGAKRVRDHVAEGVQPRIYSSRVLAQYVALSGNMRSDLNVARLDSRLQIQLMSRTLDL